MSHTFFLIIALVTTGIFLIQFVLSIFFGDLDADVDVDTDISSVVSFKGLTHFGIGFAQCLVGSEMCIRDRESLPTATSQPHGTDRPACGT